MPSRIVGGPTRPGTAPKGSARVASASVKASASASAAPAAPIRDAAVARAPTKPAAAGPSTAPARTAAAPAASSAAIAGPATRAPLLVRRPSAAASATHKAVATAAATPRSRRFTGSSSSLGPGAHAQHPAAGGASAGASAIHAKVDARKMLDAAAIKIQRWYRLVLSRLKYERQVQRLRNTSAARAIQFAWMHYTYRVGPKIPRDFERWVSFHRARLLRRMRLILRRGLLLRRHAAILIVRFMRWRVLRPLRARTLRASRAARLVQNWYRIIARRRFLKSLRSDVELHMLDLIAAEASLRTIAVCEQRIAFVCRNILESEHRALTAAGDHLEAYHLFLRGGGYDGRIARTQQRVAAGEAVGRGMVAEAERAAWDNMRYEHIFQRRAAHARAADAAAAAALSATGPRDRSAFACCGSRLSPSCAALAHRAQLSLCARSPNAASTMSSPTGGADAVAVAADDERVVADRYAQDAPRLPGVATLVAKTADEGVGDRQPLRRRELYTSISLLL